MTFLSLSFHGPHIITTGLPCTIYLDTLLFWQIKMCLFLPICRNCYCIALTLKLHELTRWQTSQIFLLTLLANCPQFSMKNTKKYAICCYLYLALKALNWKTIFSQFHLNVNPKDISADQTHISRLVFTAFNVENAADKIGFQSCYPYKLASDLRELIQTRHRWKKWQLKCCILPMYWLILSTYHTCPKIWNSPF